MWSERLLYYPHAIETTCTEDTPKADLVRFVEAQLGVKLEDWQRRLLRDVWLRSTVTNRPINITGITT